MRACGRKPGGTSTSDDRNHRNGTDRRRRGQDDVGVVTIRISLTSGRMAHRSQMENKLQPRRFCLDGACARDAGEVHSGGLDKLRGHRGFFSQGGRGLRSLAFPGGLGGIGRWWVLWCQCSAPRSAVYSGGGLLRGIHRVSSHGCRGKMRCDQWRGKVRDEMLTRLEPPE